MASDADGTGVEVNTYTWERSDEESVKRYESWAVTVGDDGDVRWTRTALR